VPVSLLSGTMAEIVTFSVNDDTISQARFKVRTSLAYTLAAGTSAIFAVQWLFGNPAHLNGWKFLLALAIPTYICLYFLSIYIVGKPSFGSIELSGIGLNLPPLTSGPIPWRQIDAITMGVETQGNTGE